METTLFFIGSSAQYKENNTSFGMKLLSKQDSLHQHYSRYACCENVFLQAPIYWNEGKLKSDKK